jgi:hypothetical protein
VITTYLEVKNMAEDGWIMVGKGTAALVGLAAVGAGLYGIFAWGQSNGITKGNEWTMEALVNEGRLIPDDSCLRIDYDGRKPSTQRRGGSSTMAHYGSKTTSKLDERIYAVEGGKCDGLDLVVTRQSASGPATDITATMKVDGTTYKIENNMRNVNTYELSTVWNQVDQVE